MAVPSLVFVVGAWVPATAGRPGQGPVVERGPHRRHRQPPGLPVRQ
nr:hypothetical protein [Rhodococcus opacus]UDG96759.1 hypothetical protein K2Z90_007017 [Rhodococcus opacus PD630]